MSIANIAMMLKKKKKELHETISKSTLSGYETAHTV